MEVLQNVTKIKIRPEILERERQNGHIYGNYCLFTRPGTLKRIGQIQIQPFKLTNKF